MDLSATLAALELREAACSAREALLHSVEQRSTGSSERSRATPNSWAEAVGGGGYSPLPRTHRHSSPLFSAARWGEEPVLRRDSSPFLTAASTPWLRGEAASSAASAAAALRRGLELQEATLARERSTLSQQAAALCEGWAALRALAAALERDAWHDVDRQQPEAGGGRWRTSAGVSPSRAALQRQAAELELRAAAVEAAESEAASERARLEAAWGELFSGLNEMEAARELSARIAADGAATVAAAAERRARRAQRRAAAEPASPRTPSSAELAEAVAAVRSAGSREIEILRSLRDQKTAASRRRREPRYSV
jgi:hypothetical protein